MSGNTDPNASDYQCFHDNLKAIYIGANGKLIISRHVDLARRSDENAIVSQATIEALTADLVEHVVPLEVARIRKNDDTVNAMMSKGILVGSGYGESIEIRIVGDLHFQNLQFIDIILSAIEVNLGETNSTALQLGSFFKRSQPRASVALNEVIVDRFDLRGEAIQAVDIVNSTICQLDAFPPNITSLTIGIKFTMGADIPSFMCSTHGRYTGAMFRAIQSHLDSSTSALRSVTIRTLTDEPEVYHSLIGFMKFVNMRELYVIVFNTVTSDEIMIVGVLTCSEHGVFGTSWSINATIRRRSAPYWGTSKYVFAAEAMIAANRQGALRLIKLVDNLRAAAAQDTMEQRL
jgi:hypothetical protein